MFSWDKNHHCLPMFAMGLGKICISVVSTGAEQQRRSYKWNKSAQFQPAFGKTWPTQNISKHVPHLQQCQITQISWTNLSGSNAAQLQLRNSGSAKRKAPGNSETAARTMSGSFFHSSPTSPLAGPMQQPGE
jgi:hypothetical protein